MIARIKSFLYLGQLLVRVHLREFKRWQSLSLVGNKRTVFYGHDRIPGMGEKASGGIIKFQDLQGSYPNTVRGANLLYLVSSDLPSFAPVMVRYAKRKKVKFVLNQNGTVYPGWYGAGWEKANRPMQELLRMADYVFYQSKFCKKAADIHLGHREDRFEILYNPVDTKRFVPAGTRPEGRKLLLAGSHHQLYRVRSAVETIDCLRKKIPDIHLTIAGKFCWQSDPADAKAQLLSLIRDLNLSEKISIQGAYSQQQVVALMHNHHVLLHTKYNDPCPRLVAEALACGLPVVYSRSGGVPELVGTEAGIGVNAPLDWENLHPPSPEELAAAVVRVFSDYSRYASAARKQAEEFLDVQPWIQRHEKIFEMNLQ